MSTTTRTASRNSRFDPSAAYETPAALAADGSLTVDQRLEMLRRWDYDVREQLVANSEGMGRATPGVDLRDIAQAIQRLEAGEASATTSTPTQHGALRDARMKVPDPEQPRADVPYDEIPFQAGPGQQSEAPRRVPVSILSLFALLGGFGALIVTAAVLSAPLVAVVGFIALSGLIVFASRRRR